MFFDFQGQKVLLKAEFEGTLGDEDMTTLDMTKNIAYMHICQVISSANYSIIYLCYPEQK